MPTFTLCTCTDIVLFIRLFKHIEPLHTVHTYLVITVSLTSPDWKRAFSTAAFSRRMECSREKASKGRETGMWPAGNAHFGEREGQQSLVDTPTGFVPGAGLGEGPD